MKNLKKVLALGLALVMMLGMFTVASAAETKKTAQEFTDWASVSNKDAVSLMVDLGVINGLPDGTYAPAQTIDRASWAKMVFFVLTGETNGDIYASDYPALKDIAKNWAQGYIEYLYSIKCISGDNLGNYNPSQPISVVAAAKTMLTGLGYNSKIEGYEADANWATNIMNKAKSIGLLNGISLKQNDNISRDAAAQMVYNALSAKTVTAKYTLNFMTGERVPSGEYTEGETLGEKAFEIRKFICTVASVSDGKATFDTSDKKKAPTGDVKASLGDVGKTVAVWAKFSTNTDNNGKTTYTPDKAVSTSVAAATNTALKVVTGGITSWTAAADKDDKDNFVVEVDTGVKYYVNGVSQDSAPAAPVAGDVIEFYDNDDNGKADLIHVYNYKVAKLTADPKSLTKNDKTTVTIAGIGGLSGTPVEQITGDWASLKKGDIVLYYAQGTGPDMIVSLEKAPVFTGKVAARNSDGELTIGSTKYKKSGLTTAVVEKEFAAWDDFKNEFEFYTDKNGTICYTNQITDEKDTSKVAVILQTAWVGGNGGIGASQYMEAKLMFEDASTDIVRISSLDGKKPVETTATDATKEVVYTAADYVAMTNFFNYETDKDGYYELTKLEGTQAKSETETAIANKAAFMSGKTGNSKTIFFIAKGTDDVTYSVVTGVANVPKMTAKQNIVVEKDSAATYVFLKADAFDGDAPSGKYFLCSAAADTYADYSVVKVLNPQGVEETMKIKTSALQTITDAAALKFFTVKSVDGDGIVSEINTEVLDVLSSGKTIDSFANGTIKLADTDAQSYDESTVIVLVDLDKDGKYSSVSVIDPSNVSIDTDAQLYSAVKAVTDPAVTSEKNETADYVYVVRRAAA